MQYEIHQRDSRQVLPVQVFPHASWLVSEELTCGTATWRPGSAASEAFLSERACPGQRQRSSLPEEKLAPPRGGHWKVDPEVRHALAAFCSPETGGGGSYGAGRAVVVQCHLELGAFAATLDERRRTRTRTRSIPVSSLCRHHARGGNARIEFIGGVIRSRFLWFNEDRTVSFCRHLPSPANMCYSASAPSGLLTSSLLLSFSFMIFSSL
eukprot:758234-Hanusia_phi.AAC.1